MYVYLRNYTYLDASETRKRGLRQRFPGRAVSRINIINTIAIIIIIITTIIAITITIVTTMNITIITIITTTIITNYGRAVSRSVRIRDKDLYTATNKCLQRLMNIMYTVF